MYIVGGKVLQVVRPSNAVWGAAGGGGLGWCTGYGEGQVSGRQTLMVHANKCGMAHPPPDQTNGMA